LLARVGIFTERRLEAMCNPNSMAGAETRTINANPGSDNIAESAAPMRQVTPPWTQEKAEKLQASADRIFGSAGSSLLGLEFSFTLADPFLEGCPIIGCSTGFTKLCGYELHEIVGRNCPSLVDLVPREMVDQKMQKHWLSFCEAARCGKDYTIPDAEREVWMPDNRPSDEIWSMQTNTRKDGSVFNNMSYLRTFRIGAELGEEEPYIVGLQLELPGGYDTLQTLSEYHDQLDRNMVELAQGLSASHFVQCALERQVPA